MVINYCDRCGELMRSDDGKAQLTVCRECCAGRRPRVVRTRDSGQIPYSQRPSSGEIRRDIQRNVRLK